MKDMTPEQICQYKQILLKTLENFNSFCERHKLNYFAAYGTVIGAVRHKGHIPWDDDIDVYMLREDYERFKTLNEEALKIGYRIESPKNEGYTAMFSKYMDDNTTLWETECNPYTIGVYIDIFPLDYVETEKQFLSNYKKIQRAFFSYLRIHHHTTIDKFLASLRNKKWKKIYGLLLSLFKYGFNEAKARNTFLDMEKKIGKSPKKQMLASYMGPYKLKELYMSEWFSEKIMTDFEGMQIAIPIGYDSYLKQLYGDYMKYPPLDKQVSHHFHYYVNFQKKMTVEEVKKILHPNSHN